MFHFLNRARRDEDDAALRRNAHHFLTRERLSEEELNEWIEAGFGDKLRSCNCPYEQMRDRFKEELGKECQDFFGDHTSLRTAKGMAFMLATMVSTIEEAKSADFHTSRTPATPYCGLLNALQVLAAGEQLNYSGRELVRHGEALLGQMSDYAREAALVLPVTLKSQAARDAIRTTSRGMPAIDLKFSAMAREYAQHIARPAFLAYGKEQ